MDQEGADNGLRGPLQRPALVLCQWQEATVVAEGDATWALRTHHSGSMPHPGKVGRLSSCGMVQTSPGQLRYLRRGPQRVYYLSFW